MQEPPPPPFGIPAAGASAKPAVVPTPQHRIPTASAIPGVVATGRHQRSWSWEGNNADGLVASNKGTILFANNDAGNVMQMDPATGPATVDYRDTNTGGAVSRSKNGACSSCRGDSRWG